MQLSRVLEPEVMDTEEVACDYDTMDHAEVNARFCDDLLAIRPDLHRVADVGTGTALIPIELCRRLPGVRVVAIDAAVHMLKLAQHRVEAEGLDRRITLVLDDGKRTSLADAEFDAVISNSIVHHIPRPEEVLREMWRITEPGGLLFVRDLARPSTEAELCALVERYAPVPLSAAASERAAFERQRGLFADSLRAALTVGELRAMVAELGMVAPAVQRTSDRHWTLAHVKPP